MTRSEWLAALRGERRVRIGDVIPVRSNVWNEATI